MDWENFIRPNGHRCVTDYLCELEERPDLIIEDLFGLSSKYYEFAYSHKELTPKGFITNCAHPSSSGNEKISDILYKSIINNQFINLNNKHFDKSFLKII